MEGREGYLREKDASAKMRPYQPVRILVTAPTPLAILEEVSRPVTMNIDPEG